MPRGYVLVIPGFEPETFKNASKAADKIIGQDPDRNKGRLVSQLAAMQVGDTVFLANNVQVHVTGQDDEEEHDLPIPPEGPEGPGVLPPVDEGRE